MKLISEEFNKSGLKFDKTTQTLLELPYEYNGLKIQGNSFVTSYAFNNTIKKLFYNIMFLYRASNVADFNVFDKNVYSLKTLSQVPFLSSAKYDKKFSITSNNIFLSSVGGVLLRNDFNTDQNYLIVAEKNKLNVFEISELSTKLLFNTTLIDPISGDITFKDIADLKYDNQENLYVVDSEYNNIYQYYINSYSISENLTKNRLFIKNFIGGYGVVDDKIKFNKIKNICINDNFLVVQDIGDKCFKVFDKNLNWKYTCVFYKFFEKHLFLDGIMLDSKNNLYCGKGNKIYKFDFDKDRGYINYVEYNISSYLRENEHIISFLNIYYEREVAYVVTNKGIKKIWLSVLDYVIGEHLVADRDQEIRWAASCSENTNEDKLIIFSNFLNYENISVHQDSLFIDSLIKNDFEIYSLDDLILKENEYVQSWTILKNLKKIYYNLFLFIKNLKYRYKEDGGEFYPIIGEKVISERFISFSDSIEYDVNFDIGINEIFQSEAINRTVKQIFDFQKIMLLYIVNNINDNVYYSPDPERNNPLVKKYIYYSDESVNLIPNPVKLDIFGNINPGDGVLVSLGGAPYKGIDGFTIEDGVNI